MIWTRAICVGIILTSQVVQGTQHLLSKKLADYLNVVVKKGKEEQVAI